MTEFEQGRARCFNLETNMGSTILNKNVESCHVY